MKTHPGAPGKGLMAALAVACACFVRCSGADDPDPRFKAVVTIRVPQELIAPDDDLPCEVVLRNAGDRVLPVFGTVGYPGGFSFEMLREGQRVPSVEGYRSPTSEYRLLPGQSTTVNVDLSRVFRVSGTGSYRVRCSYRILEMTIRGEAHIETLCTSDWVGFSVARDKQVDARMEKYRTVLGAESREDTIAVLRSMREDPLKVVRPFLSRVMAVTGVADRALREAAMLVLLDRKEAIVSLPRDEVVRMVLAASASDSPELREAAARCLWLNWAGMNEFSERFNIPEWFDRESSPRARACLAGRMTGKDAVGKATTIAIHDPAPEVRIAAFERVVELDREKALALAERLAGDEGVIHYLGAETTVGRAATKRATDLRRQAEKDNESVRKHPPP